VSAPAAAELAQADLYAISIDKDEIYVLVTEKSATIEFMSS
jgi:hypothetical protein